MTPNRASAALIAVAVLGTISTRVYLKVDADGISVPEALWVIYRFFTIWTNTLIGFACAMIAVGRPVSARSISGLLLSIAIVVLVYHTLLAHLQSYQGVDLFIDNMLHIAIPLAFLGYWVFFVPKDELSLLVIPHWFVLPMVYCAYAMARAGFDGVYPYHFLNLAELGLVRTAINVVGLLVVFTLVGAVIVGVSRLTTRPGAGR